MNKNRINLMPNDYKSLHAFNWDAVLVSSMVVIVGVVSAMAFSVSSRVKSLNSEYSLVNVENQNIEKQISKLAYMEENEKLEQMRSKLVRQVMGKDLKWSLAFKEISHLIPEKTWLVKMNAKKKNGKLDLSLEGKTSSQTKMTNFYKDLEHSNYYNSLVVRSSEIIQGYEPQLYKFLFSSATLASVDPKQESKEVKK